MRTTAFFIPSLNNPQPPPRTSRCANWWCSCTEHILLFCVTVHVLYEARYRRRKGSNIQTIKLSRSFKQPKHCTRWSVWACSVNFQSCKITDNLCCLSVLSCLVLQCVLSSIHTQSVSISGVHTCMTFMCTMVCFLLIYLFCITLLIGYTEMGQHEEVD